MQKGHYTWWGNANAPYREVGVGGLEAAIDWVSDRRPRILYITPDYPDYQADLLFHGLVTLLGRDHVVVHPPRAQYNTPADFEPTPNLAIVHFQLGEQRSYTDDEVVSMVKAGVFNWIFVSRPYYDGPSQNVVRRLVGETGAAFVVLDDDSTIVDGDAVIHLSHRLLQDRVDAYFMKEWRQGAYPRVRPLQFAYPRELVPNVGGAPPWDRPIPFNFVCKPVSQMRVETAEALRPMLEEYPGSVIELDRSVPHVEYRDIMLQSKVTVSAMGTKFDCPRFYEAMAFGTALVSQRLGIDLLPAPKQGRDYCVFRNLDALPELMRELLDGPWAEMAFNGHTFFDRHYTTVARAKQVLGFLGWRPDGGYS